MRQRGLPGAFTERRSITARDYAYAFGKPVAQEGYRGYFDLDFLIDQDNDEVYLGEPQSRICGASPMTNHAAFAYADAPLFFFHLLEFSGAEFDLDGGHERALEEPEIHRQLEPAGDEAHRRQRRYRRGGARVGHLSHGRCRQRDLPSLRLPPPGGESENEAFWLRITGPGDYRYEGADLGILITRGRSMSDDFKLNAAPQTGSAASRAATRAGRWATFRTRRGGTDGRRVQDP